MAMVRFASTCDITRPNGDLCNHRSVEYTAWPTCRDCYADVCPDHMQPGTYVESDGRESCVCLPCAAISDSEGR